MVARGRDGVIGGTTQLSSIIDGHLGYHGVGFDESATHAVSDEVVFLFSSRGLPTRTELADAQAQLAANRALPSAAIGRLQGSHPSVVAPPDEPSTARSFLSLLHDRKPDQATAIAMTHLVVLHPDYQFNAATVAARANAATLTDMHVAVTAAHRRLEGPAPQRQRCRHADPRRDRHTKRCRIAYPRNARSARAGVGFGHRV